MRIETPEDFLERLLKNLMRLPRSRRPIKVEIDLDFLIKLFEQQNGRCAFTNVPMTTYYGIEAICIDRISYNDGYIPDNVHLICQWASHARHHRSLESFKLALNHFLTANQKTT
jgi:hypothetical protein